MSHPNDTLNGKLLAWERPEDKHLRRRFGYWQMVEERMVRAQLEEEGVAPDSPCFFMSVAKRIEENHKDDPKPWKLAGPADGRWGAVRQQAAFERDAAVERAKDEAIKALIEIRDGHNDPRALAAQVLAALDEAGKAQG
jgi:glycine/D-amino acid oxidase-like deaminating enzyme